MKIIDIIENMIVLCAVLFFFSAIVFVFTLSVGVFLKNRDYETIISYSGFVVVNSIMFGAALKIIHYAIVEYDRIDQ